MKEGLVITFDQLPKAVSQLFIELADIKELLSQTRQAPTEEDKPLNIQEAAAYLNLAVPTVYALVGSRTISHYKKGRKLYFSKLELTDWIKSGRKRTALEISTEAANSVGKKRS